MNKEMLELLEKCPTVPAVKDDGFSKALESPCALVMLVNSNIFTVGDTVSQAHAAGKKVFVHIDLAEGIGKDSSGIRFLKQCGTDGIISTKAGIIRMAKEQGLLTVQRVFALDSKGLASAVDAIKASKPDFAEILPGIAYKAITRLSAEKIPVIAGGLISSKDEVISALGAGAVAVSTGQSELWYI